MSKWISVKDRLPRPMKMEKGFSSYSDEVLVYDKSEGILIAYLTLYKAGGYRKEDEYRWIESTTGCGCCEAFLVVTHWQPLPKPPEEKVKGRNNLGEM